MSYTFRWSINGKPEARTDGSGCVDFDMQVEYSGDAGITWQVAPGRHKTFSLMATTLVPINAMLQGTLQQKWQKGAALATLLTSSMETIPVPIMGWSDAELQALLAANDLAAAQAVATDAFLLLPLFGGSYPIKFVW